MKETLRVFVRFIYEVFVFTGEVTQRFRTPSFFRLAAVCFVFSVAFFTFSGRLSAQTNAEISGRITDPKGLVVANAEVVALNIDTGVRYPGKTNEDGIYRIGGLLPGNYRIIVTEPGFMQIVKTGIELHIQDLVTLNFSLTVGAVSEVVTVQGGGININTTDGTVGTVVEREFVENMPLNGRSFQSLITITPGVNTVTTSSNTQGQFVVNGQRSDTNYFTVDGVSAMAAPSSAGITASSGGAGAGVAVAATGGYQSLVSVDALQEFKITTSSYAPEFGRFPGGQISLLTRSGTNDFHGDVFDYLRNTDLDANDWFLNSARKPRGIVQQNDFGGVVGGPIIKDKLFFFGSYEGLRLSNPTPGSILVPTASARALAAMAVNNGVTGYMAQFLNAYPLPTPGQANATAVCTTVSNCSANFVSSFPGKNHLDAYSIRGDYTMNSNNTIYFRFADTPSAVITTNAADSLPITFTNQVYDAGWNRIINSRMTNNLIFGYSYVTRVASDVPLAYTGGLSAIFPAGFAQPPAGYDLGNMAVQIEPLGSNLALEQHATNQGDGQLQIIDTLGWTVGAHELKFGVDYRQLHSSFTQPAFNGIYQFGQLANNVNACTVGAVTTLPAYICGNASFTSTQHVGAQGFAFNQYSSFAQDTWKVNSRLTLTFGLRWDINPALGYLTHRPTFAIAPAGFNLADMSHFAIAPFGTQLYATTWANIAPRLGLAWQQSTDSRWGRVVRAGAGLFYDTGAQAATLSQGPYNPAVNNQTPPNVQAFVRFPVTTANSVYVTPPAFLTSAPFNTSVNNLVDPFFQLPRVFQMNLALEQQLGARQSLTVSYVGALGRELLGSLAYPASLGNPAQLGNGITANSFNLFGNFASSTYHALQTKFQRQFSHGLGILASYTWAHSIDNGSQNTLATAFLPTAAQATTIVPLTVTRGSSDFDIRHTFAFSVVYDAPTPFKDHAIARAILGHWSFDPIYHYQSAMPEDINTGISSLFSTSTFPQRPNLIPGVPVYVTGTVCGKEYPMAFNGACPGGRALNNTSYSGLPMTSPALIPIINAGCAYPTGTTGLPAGTPTGPAVGAFCTPNPVGSQQVSGNVARNFVRGFPLQELDFSVHRTFPIHESIRLQFQADMFNIFNHPQFGPMGVTMNSSAFGLTGNMANSANFNNSGGTGFNPLYQLGGPRNFQFALKLYF